MNYKPWNLENSEGPAVDHMFMGRVLALEAAVAQLLALSGHDLTGMHERGFERLEVELKALSRTKRGIAESLAAEVVRDIAATSLDQLYSFALEMRAVHLANGWQLPDRG